MNFNISMEDMFILLLFLLHVFATINNNCFMPYNCCITPGVTGMNDNKRSTCYSTVVLSTCFDCTFFFLE